MTKHFPRCPICQIAAEYSVSSSNVVVQCSSCRVRFQSDEFGDLQKELTRLQLFSIPTDFANTPLLQTLRSLQQNAYPVSFWQNIHSDSHEKETKDEGKKELKRIHKARALEMPRCCICGHDNMRGNTYCAKCGSPIDRENSYSDKSENPLSSRSWHIPPWIYVALIFGTAVLAVTGANIYPMSSRKVTFTISVESNTEWYGVISGETSRNVEGSGPESWTATMNGNMLNTFSVSAIFHKWTESGYLRASILIDGMIIASEQTTAPYGIVTVTATA